MNRLRVGLLSNPSAALGAAHRTGRHVESLLRMSGMSVVDISGPTAEVARARALQIRDSLTALVVVGGDGTAALGAEIVAGTPVRLGIVPAGSGNDFARALRIPEADPDQAVRVLLHALSRPVSTIDVIEVTTALGSEDERTGLAVGNVNLGFDALVNARANSARGYASQRYTLAVLRELRRFTTLGYWVEIDGGSRTDLDASVLTICNTGMFGGGMRFSPDSRVDDGVLELAHASALSRPRLLRLFPRVFRGTHVDLSEISIEPVRTLTIGLREGTRRTTDLVAHADGEAIGPFPLRLSVVPAAVRLLADIDRTWSDSL